jgi:hypothetical protein
LAVGVKERPGWRLDSERFLVQERLRIENRIEALLFTQGIRKRPSLRSWERDLAKVALACKLLIALWRYVETGVVPAGVEIRTETIVAA